MTEQSKPSTEERLARLEETTAMLLRNQKNIAKSLQQTKDVAEAALKLLQKMEPPTNDNHSN